MLETNTSRSRKSRNNPRSDVVIENMAWKGVSPRSTCRPVCSWSRHTIRHTLVSMLVRCRKHGVVPDGTQCRGVRPWRNVRSAWNTVVSHKIVKNIEIGQEELHRVGSEHDVHFSAHITTDGERRVFICTQVHCVLGSCDHDAALLREKKDATVLNFK